MSRNKKIILFVGLPLLVICVCGCVAAVMLVPSMLNRAVATSPDTAKQVARQIAEYDLPTGYQELIGMDFFTYQMVTIARSGNRPGMIIALMQFKAAAGMSREQMEQQFRQSASNQFMSGQLKRLPDHTVTIKGKPVVLSVTDTEYQSKTSSGTQRAAQGIFEGKGGVVMVSVMGTPDDWDWDMLDKFLTSIR